MAYPTNYRYTANTNGFLLMAPWGPSGLPTTRRTRWATLCMWTRQGGRHGDCPRDLRVCRECEGRQRPLLAGERTVTAVNEELKNSPDKINETPHEAWIIKVELADPAELTSCWTPRRTRRLSRKRRGTKSRDQGQGSEISLGSFAAQAAVSRPRTSTKFVSRRW